LAINCFQLPVEHCNKAGLKPPEFKIDDAFVITIWRKRGIAFENIGGQISGQISETQQKILSLIIENNRISRRKIAESLNINESAIQKHIAKLKQLGIIERIGVTKGFWKVNI